jgi:hypothetical protein
MGFPEDPSASACLAQSTLYSRLLGADALKKSSRFCEENLQTHEFALSICKQVLLVAVTLPSVERVLTEGSSQDLSASTFASSEVQLHLAP